MLKYKVLYEHENIITWKVTIARKRNPRVGDFIREIKLIPIDSITGIKPTKTIYVYKKGIKIGTCIFQGDEVIEWIGSPKEIWPAPVAECQLSYRNEANPVFRIWIKEPRETVYIHSILPWLKEPVSMPIPQGVIR